ncbi:uncharacterized protein L201_002082 [Kwoniella dendrophila CBS 6074]|uniref:BTB domain-containing protein n=1 Tax=Kwoniella dendrophila CBS 6074 TaxID=1295534 RepID=A0AAX4JP62_9TREE
MVLPLLKSIDYPSVEESVSSSTEIWLKDLKELYENAKDRFGDVSWEKEGSSERIWSHKAIIYSRAPKAFKERYFQPAIHNFPSRSFSPALWSGKSNPSSPASLHLRLPPQHPAISQLSLLSTDTENYFNSRENNGQHQLEDGDADLFLTQLEWLYTGQGLGDVVQWMNTSSSDTDSIKESPQDLNTNGSLQDGREKLGQDLTYMWRSKLYADVNIHLEHSSIDNDHSDESDNSADSLSSTSVFASHRFILVSRSPYFATALLNSSGFLSTTTTSSKTGTYDIHLPSPPFTPASLHFCLGYIYAGHLDFSNRTFDLSTAFHIHRAATYLQLDSLIDEIESRIIFDFCHGLNYNNNNNNNNKCKCKKCLIRSQRVWRFSILPEVNSIKLKKFSQKFLVDNGWKESCWSKEIGLADLDDRKDLVNSVIETIKISNIISTFKIISKFRTRLEKLFRTNNKAQHQWISNIDEMINEIESKATQILFQNFPDIVKASEIEDLVDGTSFNIDLLETILDILVQQAGTVQGCTYAPVIYQALTDTLLTRMKDHFSSSNYPLNSSSQSIIDSARRKLLDHISRRWMQIRDANGFHSLQPWVLRDISKNIDIAVDDLQNDGSQHLFLQEQGSARSTKSNTYPTKSPQPPYDRAARHTALTSSNGPAIFPMVENQSPGLKRLRLSSSVSTTSTTTSQSNGRPPQQSMSTLAGKTNSISSEGRASTSSRSTYVQRPIDRITPTSVRTPRIPNNQSSEAGPSKFNNANPRISSDVRRAVPPLTDRKNSNNVPFDDPSNTTKRPLRLSQQPTTTAGRPIRSLKPPPESTSRSPLPARHKAPLTSERLRHRPSMNSSVPDPSLNGKPSKQPIPARSRTSSQSTGLTSVSKQRTVSGLNPKSDNTAGNTYSGPGIMLHVGIPCIVAHKDSRSRFQATIRYIGHMHDSSGPWVGVEAYDVSKLGIGTLPSGVKDGISYFMVSNIDQVHEKSALKAAANSNKLEVVFVRPSEIVFIM